MAHDQKYLAPAGANVALRPTAEVIDFAAARASRNRVHNLGMGTAKPGGATSLPYCRPAPAHP